MTDTLLPRHLIDALRAQDYYVYDAEIDQAPPRLLLNDTTLQVVSGAMFVTALRFRHNGTGACLRVGVDHTLESTFYVESIEGNALGQNEEARRIGALLRSRTQNLP